jgi:hypothetical protein
MQDKKGKRQAKTTFHDYQQIGTVFFPARIVTVGGRLDKRTIDDVRYTNPQIDVPFPEEIVNFHVPPEVDIEEMDW